MTLVVAVGVCLTLVNNYNLGVYCKGLVGKVPGNPASCPDEPCSSDPQHVLHALKWMGVVFAGILLLPVVMYYLSKLLSKIKTFWSPNLKCDNNNNNTKNNKKKSRSKSMMNEEEEEEEVDVKQHSLTQLQCKFETTTNSSLNNENIANNLENCNNIITQSSNKNNLVTSNETDCDANNQRKQSISSRRRKSSARNLQPQLQVERQSKSHSVSMAMLDAEQLLALTTNDNDASAHSRPHLSTPDDSGIGAAGLGQRRKRAHRHSVFVGAAPANWTPALFDQTGQQQQQQQQQFQRRQLSSSPLVGATRRGSSSRRLVYPEQVSAIQNSLAVPNNSHQHRHSVDSSAMGSCFALENFEQVGNR